jgi:hypothetical protein
MPIRRDALTITSDDIQEWASHVTAEHKLPVLVRRLLMATASPREADFPAGSGVRMGGWDGVVTADEGGRFWPAGRSGWELSVNKKVRTKLEKDFRERAGAHLSADSPPVEAYVAVTARRFRDRRKWPKEKQADGPWRDVRVLDAEDLASWLEHAPSVAVWFAEELGRPVHDLETAEHFLKSWTARSRGRLPSALVLAGRFRTDAAQRVVSESLTPGGGPIFLRGETVEEGALFAAAALASSPELSGRALIVRTADAWNWAVTASEDAPLLLVPLFEKASLAGKARALVPLPQVSRPPPGAVVLAALPDQPTARLLAENGWTEEESSRLVREAGGSLAALERIYAGHTRLPAWVMEAHGNDLIPALLVGSWTPQNNADRQAVTRLGMDVGEFERLWIRLSRMPEQPVERDRTGFHAPCWRWRSPRDAWEALAPFITETHLSNFSSVTQDVLAVADPRYDMPLDERFHATIYGKALRHSKALRKGLAKSLVRLAMADGRLLADTARRRGASVVSSIVRHILRPEWISWASVSDLLPYFAEAAPEDFLSALRSSQDLGPEGVAKLFEQEETMGRSPHVDLLWALETLAWNREYLGRVTTALARLAAVDRPGPGKLANRPNESLRQILHPTIPQSDSTVEDRVATCARLANDYPDLIWKLVTQFVSDSYASTTHQPKIREWRTRPLSEMSPIEDRIRELHEHANVLFRLADMRPSCFAELVSVSIRFLPEDQDRLFDLLETGKPGDTDRVEIWSALREELRRAQVSAPKRYPEKRHERIRSLHDKLTPEDPALRYGWLFSTWPNLPERADSDLEQRTERIEALRDAALAEIWRRSDRDLVLPHLVAKAPDPEILGQSLARQDFAPELEGIFASEASRTALARIWPAFLACRSTGRSSWLKEVLTGIVRERDLDLATEITVRLPTGSATWDIVDELGTPLRDAYWQQCRPTYAQLQAEQLERAIANLIVAGRPGPALTLASANHDRVRPATAIQVLNAARKDLPRIYKEDAGMVGYHVARMFEILDKPPGLESDELIRLELAYQGILEHSDREPRELFVVVERDPGLFLSLVAMIYSPESETDSQNGAEETQEPERDLRRRAAIEILGAWNGYPGCAESDPVTRNAVLSSWVSALLQGAKAQDLLDETMKPLAEVLARTAPGADRLWPNEVIRNLLESDGCPRLRHFLSIAVRNQRGVTSRGMLDGGDQERELAQKYHGEARALQVEHPEAAALLEDLAGAYEAEADLLDESVRSARRKYGED